MTKLTILISALSLLIGANAFPQVSEGILRDQFETISEIESIRALPLAIVICANGRYAADDIEVWDVALRRELEQKTPLFRVADLRRIPFFVPRGAVRESLRKEYPALSILLDWKGELCASLPLPANSQGIFILRSGSISLKLEGRPNPESIEKLRKAVALP